MFNFRKKLFNSNPDDKREGKADHIERLIAALHNRTAHYLNQKTAGWSTQKLKTFLIIFCLVGGNLILFIAAREVLTANGPPKSSRVGKLRLPKPMTDSITDHRNINHKTNKNEHDKK